MEEKKVHYYQDRDDATTLIKSVDGGEDEGLYLWQIGSKKWEKADGKAYEILNRVVLDYANTRVLTDEEAEEEIKKLSE